ncbi:amidohydrolase family protein [Streptomyces fulvoviolaceus]|uniref:amidohydrolase family protein n=1 Tax=Streptomyces fulvoviolaceus TaxID=285535 RepID=UPI001F41D55E|nr:amidohydrolase family protein [Streptomyces fulvoviolaceus]
MVAVEEHFTTAAYLEVAHGLSVWPDDKTEMTFMRGLENDAALRTKLVDFEKRLQEMDLNGTDMAVLSLNPPGVQPYETESAVPLARDFNDQLAEVIKRWPTRFAGLGTVAPQDPKQAALEIERIMGPLGLGGVMIYSHTFGRYLDEPDFELLLEAAESHNAPIYLHPRAPSPQMLAPYQKYGMVAALWGYQAEAGTHAMRLILSGAFDRHPNLKVILGHLGEGLPFWTTRLDNRYAFTYRAAGQALGMVKLELTPSEYLRRNFAVTTSGMHDPEALAFCINRLGEDNVMFAIDHPYEDSTAATAFLQDADLTETQRAKISHINAERLFHISR